MLRPILIAASIFIIPIQLSAQPAKTPEVPKQPEQRTWYPRTDTYTPEEIVGSWVYYNGDQLEFIALQKYPNNEKPRAKMLNSIPVYKLAKVKGDEAKAGIPGFATVKLEDNQSQAFIIVDVATATVGSGASELFCRDWSRILERARDWEVGQELRYINVALLSHISWKIGSEHSKGADVGIEGIFNANGKQYDQTSEQATLPAISFVTTVKVITKDDKSGKTCKSGRSSRMSQTIDLDLHEASERTKIGPTIFKDAVNHPGKK